MGSGEVFFFGVFFFFVLFCFFFCFVLFCFVFVFLLLRVVKLFFIYLFILASTAGEFVWFFFQKNSMSPSDIKWCAPKKYWFFDIKARFLAIIFVFGLFVYLLVGLLVCWGVCLFDCLTDRFVRRYTWVLIGS